MLWKPGALEEILGEENQQEILAGNLALSSTQKQENCQEEFREGSPVESIHDPGEGSHLDLEMEVS